VRIRQIKPGWWLDKELRRGLSADAREFYIGLWMLSDDAGWLDWDVERIAAELYPYGVDSPGGLLNGDPIESREVAVETWARQLVALSAAHPHLVIEPCGHARLPKLTVHQRFGGRPVYTVRDAHARDCARMRAPVARAGTVGKGNGTVVTPAQEPGPETTTSGLKAKIGSFESIVGGKP
jgi:hypothetical protein